MISSFFSLLVKSVFLTAYLFSGQAADSIRLSPDSLGVGQGKTIAVFLHSSYPLQNVEGNFLDLSFPFYPVRKEKFDTSSYKYSYRALVGIPIDAKPGKYSIRLSENQSNQIDSQGSDSAFFESTVYVVETLFKKEEITIPAPKQNLLTSQSLSKEAKIIREVLANRRENQLWKGKFIKPIEGRISSPFGIYRVYNDGTSSRPHRGVDIANLEGTPVRSPNSGKVVLSRHFDFHGNTLIIEHGQGVYSLINHMKRRFVQKGDRVKKGETLGLVGETGLATGPHVHWGLSVLDIRVDALEWTEKEW
jgi:murein DD-endopeptidase MepM/ murein hydrolase activator NlpD